MVSIRCIRPFFLRGDRVEAGAVVRAAPVDAACTVATGRAEYVSALDRDEANDGVRAADLLASPHAGAIRSSFWARRERGD